MALTGIERREGPLERHLDLGEQASLDSPSKRHSTRARSPANGRTGDTLWLLLMNAAGRRVLQAVWRQRSTRSRRQCRRDMSLQHTGLCPSTGFWQAAVPRSCPLSGAFGGHTRGSERLRVPMARHGRASGALPSYPAPGRSGAAAGPTAAHFHPVRRPSLPLPLNRSHFGPRERHAAVLVTLERQRQRHYGLAAWLGACGKTALPVVRSSLRVFVLCLLLASPGTSEGSRSRAKRRCLRAHPRPPVSQSRRPTTQTPLPRTHHCAAGSGKS